MMGPVKGNTIDPAQFGSLAPTKVLYELHGPRTFTFLDAAGELNLALWFDENAQAVRYLVVPFTEALVKDLETGHISVRQALEQPRLWVVDADDVGRPVAAIRTTLGDLPQDELPVPGTMLLPSLESRTNCSTIDAELPSGGQTGASLMSSATTAGVQQDPDQLSRG